MSQLRLPLLLALLAALFAAPAAAQHVWTGAVGSNWSDPNNWNPQTVPTLADAVTVPAGGTQPFMGGNQFCAALTVEEGATLSIGSGATLDVGSSAAPGALDLRWSGGATSTGRILLGSSSSTTLRLTGTWSQDHPDAMPNGSGWVELDGVAVQGPAAPAPFSVRLTGGTTTLDVDLDVRGDLESTGGGAAGAGSWRFSTPSSSRLELQGASVSRVELTSGVLTSTSSATSLPSRVGTLVVDGGSLRSDLGPGSSPTLEVGTLLELRSGFFGMRDSQSPSAVVLGDVLQTGPFQVDTSAYDTGAIRVFGTWTGSEPFTPGDLWVEFADGAEVAGSAPGFINVRLVSGTTTVGSAATLTGDLQSIGGVSQGPSGWRFAGASSSLLDTRGSLVHRVEIAAGVLFTTDDASSGSSVPSRVGTLVLDGGSLRANIGTGNAPSLEVMNEFDIRSGSFGVRDAEAPAMLVLGDVNQSGPVATDSSAYDAGALRVQGTWVSSVPFTLGTIWVEFTAGASIAGSAPGFGRVRLIDGTTAVESTVTVTSALESVGGSSQGGGAWRFVGSSTANLDTRGGSVHRVVLAEGPLVTLAEPVGASPAPSRVGVFVLDGGSLRADLGAESSPSLEVTERLEILSGNLGARDSESPSIVVLGDVLQAVDVTTDSSAYDAGAIRVAGRWTGGASFTPGSIWVEFTGQSAVDGVAPGFEFLRLLDGVVTVDGSVAILRDLESTGGVSSGPGEFLFTGSSSKTIESRGNSIHAVTAAEGPVQVVPFADGQSGLPTRVGTFVVDGGELRVPLGVAPGEPALEVGSLLALRGGRIGIADGGLLAVDGDVSVTGEMQSSTSAGFVDGRLRFSGSWTGSEVFDVASEWVEPGPGASFDGPLAGVGRLRLTSGVVTVNGDVRIVDHLQSTGGDSIGSGAFVFAGPGTVEIETRGNEVHTVRVEDGELRTRFFAEDMPSRVGRLELASGRLGINDSRPELEVMEDVVQTGAIAGTTSGGFTQGVLVVHGDWTGSTIFDPSSLWVEFRGSTAVQGVGPGIERLRLVDGIAQLSAPLRITDHLQSTGGVSTGAEPFVFDGPGTVEIETRGNELHAVRVEGGELRTRFFAEGQPSRVGRLELVSGRLGINDSRPELEVLERVIQTGTIGGTTSGGFTQGTLVVLGDWTGSATFDPANTWVEFTGSTIVDGDAPGFERLRLLDGVTELESDTRLTTRLESTGGVSSGVGAFLVAGPGAMSLQTQGNVLHLIRVVDGELRTNFFAEGVPSRLERLELAGGALGIVDNRPDLEVLLEVAQTGPVGGTTSGGFTNGFLRLLGRWEGDQLFNPSNVALELADGAFIEGESPSFGRLRVRGVGNEIRTSITVESALFFESGAELSVLGSSVDLLPFSYTSADGTLRIGPGGALRRPSASTTRFLAGSRFELDGSPTAPARLESAGGAGADYEFDGAFRAVNFEVSGLSTAGLELGANATVAPDAFRNGSFDAGVSSSSARLLTLDNTVGFTATNIAFENTGGAAAFNVRRNAAADVDFVNWSGSFGGSDFEDDPFTDPLNDPEGAIAWVDSTTPDLRPLVIAGPLKAVGGDSITVDWSVLNQGGGDAVAPWSERLVLSTDTTIGGNDVELGTFAVQADLASGGEVMRSTSFTVPTGLDGDYFLAVIVDATDQIAEVGSEDNNTGFQLTPITITPVPRPDVIAQAILVPATAEEGEAMSVTWDVLNDGTGDATPNGLWRDSLYLSLDPNFSGGDAFLGTFDAPVASLAVEGTYQNTQSVILPDGISGARYVIVRTDALDAIEEGLQESNNIASSAALTVEQLDLPDLLPVDIAIASEFGALIAEAQATATVSVVNQDPDGSGKGTANGLWFDRLWLSADDVLGGDSLLANQSFSGVLAPGEGYSFQRSFALPADATTWYLIAELNRTGSLAEADGANNLLVVPFDVVDASYRATVATTFTEGVSADAAGEVLVTLTGQALDNATDAPVPNADITVRVRHKGTRRVYPVTTDGAGDYTLVFEPLIGEAGRFDLYADNPAVFEDPVEDLQDAFELFDLTLNPATITSSLDVGETKSGTVWVRNPGDTQVDGATATIVGLPLHLDLVLSSLPATFAPFENVPLSYDLTALAESPDPLAAADLAVEFALDVNGTGTLASTLELPTFVNPLVVDLVATLNELDGPQPVSVPIGQYTTLQIAVTNLGGATATNVAYAVPCETEPGFLDPASTGCGFAFVPVTPTFLGDLPPGATATIEIGFVPAPSLTVGSLIQSTPGSEIQITSDQGDLGFGYTLLVDSTANGFLDLTVVDELSYFDENGALLSPPVPGLAGASVVARRFNDADTVYTGTSAMDGSVELFDAFGASVGTQVQVGTYTVEIEAPDHGSYQAVIAVAAGQTVDLIAFLPIEAVTYSFDVVPTEVEDVYDITLEADFNVIVPVPKILVEPQLIPLDLAPGETTQIDLTITNDGLITAFGMELFMDDLQPGFTVDPLTNQIGDLLGGETVVIPVTVTRSSDPSALACSYGQGWGLRHYLLAEDFLAWYWTPIWYTAPVAECGTTVSPTDPPPDLPPPPSPPSVPPGGGPGGAGNPGGSGGGGGGGSPQSPSVTSPPEVDIPTGCEES